MLPLPEARPLPRTAPRGPEPLRRKRVEPAPSPAVPARRKALNLLLGFATAVLLIDAFVGEKGLLEGLRATESYEQAEARLQALRAENARLREQMRRYRDDPAAKEALAREQLGYIRPGEVLFIIRDVAQPKR
jgi:cell division protein FtsB